MNLNFKLNLKVSAFYLEKQKSFITKKKFFLAVPPRYIQKMALAVSIFQKILELGTYIDYFTWIYYYLVMEIKGSLRHSKVVMK